MSISLYMGSHQLLLCGVEGESLLMKSPNRKAAGIQVESYSELVVQGYVD